MGGRVRSTISLALTATLLAAGLLQIPVPATSAAGTIGSPFAEGRAVRIIQGYNGGTHQGRSRYGLDLVLTEGGTSGAAVVSPIDGSVTWAQGPGAGNGCIGIALRDGSYSVTLCHVIFDRTFRSGESIARGQTLGKVGAAGRVGNNGTPHVHLELHRGRGSNNPVPFGPPEGLPLEGVALSATGAGGEHGGRTPIVAAARRAGRSEGAAPEERPRPAARSASPSESVPAERSGPSAPGPASGRAAVVRGTGSCLNVRERAAANARILDCLAEGTEVPLASASRGSEDGWRQLERGGWAAGEYLKRTRAVVSGTESCLNLRERPTTDARILGCLAEGTSVAIAEGPSTGGGSDWYRIERAGPLEKGGWAVGQYLD